MSAPPDWFNLNPITAADRRRSRSPSAWVRSFSCEDVRPLIVCRGPIRKEAMEVFEQMGIRDYGILLSEKDSIVYTQALAPELRRMRPEHVHRVRDYSGATRDERTQRVGQIIDIARRGGYTHVFAGYGFMAEDEAFVRALEQADLGFIGPRASVQAAAGHKDEAKRTALREAVSVTPGIDDVTTRLLLRKHPDLQALAAVCSEHGLLVELGDRPLQQAAEAVLAAAYERGIDLYSIDELGQEIESCAGALLQSHPGGRVRLKAIGGGGGKGQRIVTAAEQAPAMVREILAEVKAGGVGDNKNILLELNIEQTRHNEIQLIGNGRWCVSLGGRDCSLQMHEQKLLEVSLTQEALASAMDQARAAGREQEALALEQELWTLARMESEAERFGVAVGLDSASTFECIVDSAQRSGAPSIDSAQRSGAPFIERPRHYFMEVNTRIQVEHRVSELCYALRFAAPQDAPAAGDSFEVTSLVECMVLLARHGERLPRPERVPREGAALEARLNATDRSLLPHAGGMIVSWSDPIEHEIRDDQGICVKNPDTGVFMHYRLAGAYDSNIALLVTYGRDRRESYERLSEILRRTSLRGNDLQTNLEFHYGLLHFFLSHGVWAKPTTRFVVPYLTQVGLLHEETGQIGLHWLWSQLCAALEGRVQAKAGPMRQALHRALGAKETLVKRPLWRMFREPHYLSAWLSAHRADFAVRDGRVVWLRNPLLVLADTYWLLNMDFRQSAPAAHVIWDHDRDLLDTGVGFYRRLEQMLQSVPGEPARWQDLSAALQGPAPPPDWRGLFPDALWQRVRASHAGFQCGLELLSVLPLAGQRTGFFDLRVEPDLTVTVPDRLLDPALQARMRKVLVPPPPERGSEIVAVSGGMFYAQESPDRPPFVSKGDHFDKGQPLYIIEVMKMFNKVYAAFSGTVEEILIEGGEGTIVQKGQPLFTVKPDDVPVIQDPAEQALLQRERTRSYLAQIV